MREFSLTAIPDLTPGGSFPSNRTSIMADEKCPCVITDENDNCVDCPTQLETESRNLVGLQQLVESTAREYTKRRARNTDPKNPDLPRLQLIGVLMIRIPHLNVWNQLVKQSFEQAQAMGFKETIQCWGDRVKVAYLQK